jgi:hypothetical protein
MLGEGAAVSAPVVGLTTKEVIVPPPFVAFATKRNCPLGESWSLPPATPAAKGEPATGASAPVVASMR